MGGVSFETTMEKVSDAGFFYVCKYSLKSKYFD